MPIRTIFTVKLKPEIQEKIREKARREERNISVVVERLLRAGLEDDPSEEQRSQEETTVSNGQ